MSVASPARLLYPAGMSAEETLPDDADATRWLGRVLDARYRLNTVLGSGGFGHVFRAKHLILGQDVAVKLLHVPDAAGGTARARFEREATTLATVNHPNIVHVTDYGVSDGTPYLVMELVDGESLRDLIDRAPLAPERAITLMVQILRGLGYAHERGIVHRDLKPGNVMVQSLGAEEHAKLLDFGFAKFFADAPVDVENTLTAPGQAYGSRGYVAPEVLGQQSVDGRADLYAAGVILFELIAGKRPFYSDDAVAELRASLTRMPTPLATARRELASEPLVGAIDQVIARAMDRDPAARFISAGEMAGTLRALIGERESLPASKPTPKPLQTPAPPTRSRRSLLVVAAVGIVALVASTGIVLLVLDDGDTDTTPPTAQPTPIVTEPPLEDVLLGPPIGDRPPPADPWAAALSPELAAIREKLGSGAALTGAELRVLNERTHDAPWDPRAFLLLASAHRNRGAPIAAVRGYESAYRASPSCRGDVRMLRDLLLLVLDARAGDMAGALIAEIYGSEALPAVDRALTIADAAPGAEERFTALRARLAATSD